MWDKPFKVSDDLKLPADLELVVVTPSYVITPLDDLELPKDCECEFTPDPNDSEPSCHYLRRCKSCQHIWYGLHCPHDGYQNPCPACGIEPTPLR